MKKRAQVSVEYAMIIAVAMLILLPGIALFRNYAFESNDNLISRRVLDISNVLLTKASKIYYYGPPSKSVVTIEMPPQINNMYIVSIPSNNETYLFFSLLTKNGPVDIDFQSDIPLKAGKAVACPELNLPCDNIVMFCECFPERYFTGGLRNFKVEASYNCLGVESCIIIKEISNETA